MLKLILRQIGRHKGPLALVLLVWIAGGYVLFAYNDLWFARLAGLFVSTPPPGEQQPGEAYGYIHRAEERLASESIDLRIMARSCQAFLPLRFHGNPAAYRPDWLDRMERWQVASAQRDPDDAGQAADLAQPDLYWQRHIADVLESLQDGVHASRYAWEIEPRDAGYAEPPPDDPAFAAGRRRILIAERIEAYALASCRRELAIIAWGEYAAFQEERAWRRIRAERPELEENERSAGPGEREKLILERLQGDPLYERALREYLGGPPPDPEDTRPCSHERYRLACVAPEEAAQVYHKLLEVAPGDDLPRLQLQLAFVQLLLARERAGEERARRQSLAENRLQAAALSFETELEARMALARLHLARQDSAAAYGELQQLSLARGRPGFPENEYRSLAAETLRALGRFRDADCFADLRDLAHGARRHCEDLQL